METYRIPGLEREDAVTFDGIPSEKFREKRREMDKKLYREMRKNEIRESQSIRFASGFVSASPTGDD